MAIKLSTGTDVRGNPIAYIDPSLPENKNTIAYKDTISKGFNSGQGTWGKGNWSLSPRFKNVFEPHTEGFWFWYMGKTKDHWMKFKESIRPVLEKLHQLEKESGETTDDESKESLIASTDAVISDIKTTVKGGGGGEIPSPEEGAKVINGLEDFKKMLVNLKDDEEFKKTLAKITAFNNAQGHKLSLMNSILVWMQDPQATYTMGKTRWEKNYNRSINKDAKRILVRSPAKQRYYNKDEKERITNRYVNNLGKQSVNDLSVGEVDKLGVQLSGQVGGHKFPITPEYDIRDTSQIEGKEDKSKDLFAKKDIAWFEDNMIDEKVRPIYMSLIGYVKTLNINLVFKKAEPKGSRGSSSSGTIELIENDGNDVGLTKTLAHELTHELLHQRYTKNRDPSYKQYFLGTAEGRELIEQQAELSAWMIMSSYGFDLKTTSSNYIALWGADETKMVKVFDTLLSVVNKIMTEINRRKPEIESELNASVDSGGEIPNESLMREGTDTYSLPTPQPFTGDDLANILGVENEYHEALKHEDNGIQQESLSKQELMLENFFRRVNVNIR